MICPFFALALGGLSIRRAQKAWHHTQMLRDELRCGDKYAFRERPLHEDGPLQCIQLVKHIRGRKWQVRWIDTHPGLVDYIDSAQILVPWVDRKAYLQERHDRETLRRHNSGVGFERDSAVADAVHTVFENIGDGGHFDCKDGSMSGSIDTIERLRLRAKLTEGELSATTPYSFIERSGRLRLPYECALNFARAFSRQEPAGILAAIEASEREYSLSSTNPENAYQIRLLNTWRASWALVRQWCGHDAAIAAREQRISYLEKLLWDAVYVLQKSGQDLVAAKLRKRLEND